MSYTIQPTGFHVQSGGGTPWVRSALAYHFEQPTTQPMRVWLWATGYTGAGHFSTWAGFFACRPGEAPGELAVIEAFCGPDIGSWDDHYLVDESTGMWVPDEGFNERVPSKDEVAGYEHALSGLFGTPPFGDLPATPHHDPWIEYDEDWERFRIVAARCWQGAETGDDGIVHWSEGFDRRMLTLADESVWPFLTSWY